MNRIESFVNSLVKKMRLQVSQYSETSSLALHKKFCVEVSGSWSGVEYIGLGINQDLEVALTIALAEFVEHATVRRYNLATSSGVAAHTSYFEAINNAKTELIERDSFMSHWLLHSRGRCMNASDYIHNFQIPEFFLAAHVAFSFFDISTVRGMSTVMCVAEGQDSSLKKFGLTIGLGCHHLLSKALEKAFCEAALNAAVQLSACTRERLELSSFKAQLNWTPSDHLKLALTESYAQQLASVWLPKAPPINKTAAPEFLIEKLEVPDFLGECPFVVYRAEAQGLLQDLFFGEPKIENVNLARLRALGWSGSEAEINLLPHVLG